MSPRRLVVLAFLPLVALAVTCAAAEPSAAPAKTGGPFGLSLISTASGKPVDPDDFAEVDFCNRCHARQVSELAGSMHAIAHSDALYRGFAETARREAGPEVYAWCAGCHSPAGVVTGLIPQTPEGKLPPVAKAGVTCDVCHSVSALSGAGSTLGEPGNASFVLDVGDNKHGPIEGATATAAHETVASATFRSSELCASCHTVAHPVNGVRLEHTFAEWKKSVYAEKGIQCQDCHMRSIEDARKVALTLEPVPVKGIAAKNGPTRDIAPHYFAGANVNAVALGGDKAHAAMAEERLKSAARLEIRTSAASAQGAPLAFEVAVLNVGAGHNLPTSLTDLREMWIELRVTGPDGTAWLTSGTLDAQGEINEGAIRFGTRLEDAAGKTTYKPWEAARIAWTRLVPPRGEEVEKVTVTPPAQVKGKATISARLLYRSASPAVVRAVLEGKGFTPRVVEMATAEGTVTIE